MYPNREAVLLRLLAKGVDPETASKGAGGLNMPLDTFAQPVLQQLYDQHPNPMSKDRIVNYLRNKHDTSRLRNIYNSYHKIPGDPWDLFVDDMLAEMAYHRIIVTTDDQVRLGDAFKVGVSLLVAGDKAKKGEKTRSTITFVLPRDIQQRGNKRAAVSWEIRALARDLAEDGPGLIPINPEAVDELAESMRVDGYLSNKPIEVDQHGRIIDGRQRLAAAKLVGIVAPRTITKVKDDTDAVFRAVKAKEKINSWTEKNSKELLKRFGANSLTDLKRMLGQLGVRQRVWDQLAEDKFRGLRRSNVVIAKELRCSEITIRRIRQEWDECCKNHATSTLHENMSRLGFSDNTCDENNTGAQLPQVNEPKPESELEKVRQKAGGRVGSDGKTRPGTKTNLESKTESEPTPEPKPEPIPESKPEPEPTVKVSDDGKDQRKSGFYTSLGAEVRGAGEEVVIAGRYFMDWGESIERGNIEDIPLEVKLNLKRQLGACGQYLLDCVKSIEEEIKQSNPNVIPFKRRSL